jgi:hypothetical protein
MVTKFVDLFFCRDHKNFYGKENFLKSPLLFSLTKYLGFRNWTFINVQKGKARDSLAKKRRKMKPRILKVNKFMHLLAGIH